VVLVGRTEEWATLDRILSGVRDGAGGVLVLRGEAGSGKTALLRHTEQAAAGLRIVRAAGARSETELSFAALHQLLVPFLDSVGRLPDPQRMALKTAFGLARGPAPDRLLVGIGVMSAITAAARQQPVLCVIDDAQLLDRASADALGFVARRLSAGGVGLLFAVGDDHEQRAEALNGLPELRLDGLSDEAGRDLLASVTGQLLGQSVGRQILAGTGGNPQALIAVGRSLSPAELSGAMPLPEPLRLGGRLEARLLRPVRALPSPAQALLLLAAAEPSGDPGLLWRSAALLGIDPGTSETPGIGDIIRFDSEISFVHPMMRSAVYYGAPARERRRAHQALVAASDARLEPGRYVRHLAAAVTGADLLDRAQARRLQGGVRQVLAWPAEAIGVLLEAARALYPLDPRLAREALGQAFEAALTAGHLASNPGAAEVLRAVRGVPGPHAVQAAAADLALDGFAALQAGSEAAGLARLRQATALAVRQFNDGDHLRSGFVTSAAAGELLDDAALHAIGTCGLTQAHRHGSAAQVAFMLELVGRDQALTGRFTAAEAAANEARELAAAAGPDAARRALTIELTVLAWRGREPAVRPLAEAGLREFTEAGLGFRVGLVKVALTVLELGLGHYRAALRHALSTSADTLAKTELLPELIEAAARSGAADTATPWLGKLAVRAQASGTGWALGMMLRSRALLAAEADAEELYRAAIEHLARSRIVPQLGRAHLVYGEWLRRRRRLRDARSALRSAYEILDSVGAEAFADRARRELLAAGAGVRTRNPATRQELTPQELRIAGLAGEGASNAEIASQLYISANTVAYHLKKVFRKMEVTNRAALAHALQVRG
jgi:DNA-binding CsgD family transcriptional regulator